MPVCMTVTGLVSVVVVRLNGPVALKIVSAEAFDAAPKATPSAVIAMIERQFTLLLLPQAELAQMPLVADAGTLNVCCKLANVPVSWKEMSQVKSVMCERPLLMMVDWADIRWPLNDRQRHGFASPADQALTARLRGLCNRVVC